MSAQPAAPLAKQEFDFQGQAAITHRTEELEKVHKAYLDAHPELNQVLHEYMQSLLIHKPSESLGFTSEYFKAHREKREPYKAP